MAGALLVAISLVRANLCWHVCNINIFLVNHIFRRVNTARVSMETHPIKRDIPSRDCFITGEQ